MSAKSKNNNLGFHLTKWYLDFVGKDGTVVICYAAQLGWNNYTVPYSNLLVHKPGESTIQKTSFKNAKSPLMTDGEISWRQKAFKFSGIWKKLNASLEEVLYSSKDGSLEWKCHQPRSLVVLNIEDEKLTGEGYAEELYMTIPTWKIPMNELRWGHFFSENHCLVWIEIKEKDIKQWVWVNNDLVEGSTITDSEVLIPSRNLKILMDQKEVLENDQKIKSVVRKLDRFLPGFAKIIPKNFLLADETKWYSRAKLYQDNDMISKGQCIHEFVDFK
ncbi:hypothetical protein [uncultured Eudoraea sp.]|uniref:hypothetical protein n=1 Tax=uncultured Eudoraea sp. TaxID=1035614 RepID=UPI00262379C0|nr:hypothetical protein [uncultured Eudoraea sp.]